MNDVNEKSIAEAEAGLESLAGVSARYRQQAEAARAKVETTTGGIRDRYEEIAVSFDKAAVANDKRTADTTAKVNRLLGRQAS